MGEANKKRTKNNQEMFKDFGILAMLSFFSGAGKLHPIFDMPRFNTGGDYWRRYTGKSKTFKKNKRRGF